MDKIYRTRFVLLISILITSTILNVALYREKLDYFLELNRTRLEPLGISMFPIDDASFAKQPGQLTIVFFGDSRAAEWPAPAEITDATFVNRGIAGQTSAQVAGRFAQHVAPLHPDKIILQVGVNDLMDIQLFPEQRKSIVGHCKANIQTIVTLALQANASEMILTTIFPLGPLPMERRFFGADDVSSAIAEVNAFIRSLASDKVTVFDTGRILAGADGMIQPKYSRDYLHLNEDGYAALNRELAQLLSK